MFVSKKYDWPQLKNMFIMGKWLSLADFFKDQGVKYNSHSRKNASGWLEQRRRYQEEVTTKTLKKVTDDEVNVRLRQQKLSHRLQLKGIKELENLEVRNVDDARKLIVDGMREEREALGIDNRIPKNANLTQVNMTLPKTRLDDFIESANYEQILELLAEVKRERARRRDKIVTT